MCSRHIRWRLLPVIGPLLLSAAPALAAEAGSASKVWETQPPHQFGGNPGPKFDKGLILAHEFDPPRMSVYDSSGKLVTRTQLSIPSADRLAIRAMAAGTFGVIVVAGAAQNWGGQAASFLAWVSASGALNRVVRASPFNPAQVCVAPDGSVWAAGDESEAARKGRVPNHNILRRYDAEGRLTHAALPWAMLGSREFPHPASRSSLTCAPDRVGFFSFSMNEWIEVSLSGELLGRWKGVEMGGATKASGMALLPGGHVYATTFSQVKGSREATAALYRLDRQTGRWLAVAAGEDVFGGDPAMRHGGILGTDGPNLVLFHSPGRFVGVTLAQSP